MSDNVELWALAQRAFPVHPVPAADVLSPDFMGQGDAESIRDRFGNRSWAAIATDELENFPDTLYFLSPTGFRYLLPAYLHPILRDPEEFIHLADQVISCLTSRRQLKSRSTYSDRALPVHSTVLRDLLASVAQPDPLRESRIAAFSRPQRLALAAILTWLEDRVPSLGEEFDLLELIQNLSDVGISDA